MNNAVNQPDLSALRDIHLPEPVSWWPLAPGWWIVLAVVVLCLITLLVVKKIRQRKQLTKAALAELENIRSSYRQDANAVELIRSISILLRRASQSFYPKADVQGLTGEAWLHYLDSTANEKGFQSSRGKILATAPYLPEHEFPEIDSEDILTLCEAWIRAQPQRGKSR